MKDTPSPPPDTDTRTEVYFPFEWKIDTLDRMVNFEIVGHPIYNGIEIQGFCDQNRKGMLVFLTRTQTDLTDVYYESSLRNKLDSSLYGIGGGLGIWQELDPTKKTIIELDVSDDKGVEARLDFHDIDGRHIEVYLKDPTPRARQQQRRRSGRRGPSSSSLWSEFLAPVGSAIVHPKHLLLVWMSQFDLFYRPAAGRTSTNFIRIDDTFVDTGHLPMEWFLRRRLIKVAKNLFIVMVNPVVSNNNEDDTNNRQPVPETYDKDNSTNIRTIDDQGRLESLEAKVGNHSARMEFTSPFPNCNCIIDDDSFFNNQEEEGRFKITLDGTTVVTGGTWNVVKQQQQQQQREARDNSTKESTAKTTSTVHVSLDIDEGWIPGRGRISRLMRFVTWAAKDVFRQWPTTYRYTSTIWYDDESHQHWMEPKWERTTQQQRAEKYRSMMGTD